jgi:eukaryotic-like serine/threonine-protein kinase
VETGGSLLAGRYRIVKPLGTGGMATVLLCEDQRLGRKVAIKRLHSHHAKDVARRFLREAKLGASLNHPNVVSVFDTATDGDSVLIVMEYVEGETLADALKRGRIAPERVAAIVRDVGAALDHAHGHGVVHRDVKPGNILLRDDGVTKVVDLGIATAANLTRITASGTVLGTAAYMAPEQLEGGDAGPKVDVYALATVVYEALAGKKARGGRTPMEIAHRVATEAPPDLRGDWPEAPAAVAEALKRAMALDPEERPASAGELAVELAGALDENPTAPTRPVAEPAPQPEPAPTPPPPKSESRPAAPPRLLRPPAGPSRSSRVRSALALAAVLLAVAGVVAAAALTGGDDDDERAGGGSAPPAEQPRETPAEAPAASQPGSGGPAEGARLNSQGYALMKAGRYDEAIPVLERAVASYPRGTTDLQYAYALYNLGRSLRLGGRPDDAVPVLERRLRIPNQTGTVRRELEAARRDASG